MATTRRTLLDTTGALLERQGYHATGVNQILSVSGLQRGSLYHHFPGGKEELAVAAILDRARRSERFVERYLASSPDPAEAVQALVLALADRVAHDADGASPPFAAVTLETGPGLERLREACRLAYAGVRACFEAKLLASAHEAARAASLAVVITAVIDGAFVLCRVDGDASPLRQAAKELATLLRRAQPEGATATHASTVGYDA
jgi:TetR/AcrR family transcriptional regulator, lmrAB and yxaGH operons repressor